MTTPNMNRPLPRHVSYRDRLTEQDPATQATLKIFETIANDGLFGWQKQVETILTFVRDAIAQAVEENTNQPQTVNGESVQITAEVETIK